MNPQPKQKFEEDLWTKTTDMRFDHRSGRANTVNYATTMDSSVRVNFQVQFFFSLSKNYDLNLSLAVVGAPGAHR